MLEQRRRQRGAAPEDQVRAVLRLDAANALDDVRSKALERAPFKTFRTVGSDIFVRRHLRNGLGTLVVGAESCPEGSGQLRGNERAERLVGREHREPACRIRPKVNDRVSFHGWEKLEEPLELSLGVPRLGLKDAPKYLLNLVG